MRVKCCEAHFPREFFIVMARKRLSKEFASLSEIESPTKLAKAHGILTDLTQMDNGEKHFEGRIADDQRSMRVVGFEKRQQQQLAT